MKTNAVEIERKYVIELPPIEKMEAEEDYSRDLIMQTYLRSEPGITRRVRKRFCKGGAQFTETKKMRIDKISSYEDEREITEEEYLSLLSEIAEGTKTLEKTRHSFFYRGAKLEIDVYPEWKHSCILETELPDREAKVAFPPYVKVIAEVTGRREYSNASMSRSFPKELPLKEEI